MVIVLTAHHGNQDNPPTGADRYAVPFYVWGAGVKAGADLYALNAGTRQVAASYCSFICALNGIDVPGISLLQRTFLKDNQPAAVVSFLLQLGPVSLQCLT